MGEECSWFDTDWKQEDKKQTVYRVKSQVCIYKKKKKTQKEKYQNINSGCTWMVNYRWLCCCCFWKYFPINSS